MRQKLRYTLYVCFAIVAAWVTFGRPMTAEAAKEYQKVYKYSNQDITKVGKYYFKYDGSDQSTYISKSKDSGYKKTSMGDNAFTNGKQVYYMEDNVLYLYKLSTGKSKKLKSFKEKSDAGYTISTIYGKKIYITRGSFEEWDYTTYSYNIKTKKVKKEKADFYITDRSGKYVLVMTEFRTDVSSQAVYLYKITSKGLKKVKTLAKNGYNAAFVNGKIYYTSFPSADSMKKNTLYCCKKNGKSRKVIRTFSGNGEWGSAMIYEIRPKYCYVNIDWEKTYKYTYATGEMTEVE